MLTIEKSNWEEPQGTGASHPVAIRYRIPLGVAITLSLVPIVAFDLVEFGSQKISAWQYAIAMAVSAVLAIATSVNLSKRYRRGEIVVISSVFTLLTFTYFLFDADSLNGFGVYSYLLDVPYVEAAPTRHFLAALAIFQLCTYMACRTPGTPSSVMRYIGAMFTPTMKPKWDDFNLTHMNHGMFAGFSELAPIQVPKTQRHAAVSSATSPYSKATRSFLYLLAAAAFIAACLFYWGPLFYEITRFQASFAPKGPYLFSALSMIGALLLLVATLPKRT